MNDSCSIVFPIDRLPPEILSHIFVLGLPHVHIPSRKALSHRASVRKQQILPGSVCSAWRTLSHRTPLLWSLIFTARYNGLGHSKEKKSIHDEISALVIRRSGAVDLDLCIDFTAPAAHRYLSSLLLPRARTVFILVGGALKKSLPIFYRETAPRLRDLTIWGTNTIWLRKGIGKFLKECSRLERLDLCQAPANTRILLNIPLLSTSLREVDLWFCSRYQAQVSPFILSPNLVHVTLDIGDLSTDGSCSKHALSWPVLKSLKSLSVHCRNNWVPYIASALDRSPGLIALQLQVSQPIIALLRPRYFAHFGDQEGLLLPAREINSLQLLRLEPPSVISSSTALLEEWIAMLQCRQAGLDVECYCDTPDEFIAACGGKLPPGITVEPKETPRVPLASLDNIYE